MNSNTPRKIAIICGITMMKIPDLHKKSGPESISFYLLIISTSMSKDPQPVTITSPHPNDKTTPLVKKICTQNGITLLGVDLVSDNKLKIQLQAKQIIENHHPDILITSGGTGISPADQTPEALLPFFEKSLTGFEVLFHNLSFQEIGAATILGRATAGIYNNTPVFLLPGSPNAVKMALEQIIIPEAKHILAMTKQPESTENE